MTRTVDRELSAQRIRLRGLVMVRHLDLVGHSLTVLCSLQAREESFQVIQDLSLLSLQTALVSMNCLRQHWHMPSSSRSLDNTVFCGSCRHQGPVGYSQHRHDARRKRLSVLLFEWQSIRLSKIPTSWIDGCCSLNVICCTPTTRLLNSQSPVL